MFIYKASLQHAVDELSRATGLYRTSAPRLPFPRHANADKILRVLEILPLLLTTTLRSV